MLWPIEVWSRNLSTTVKEQTYECSLSFQQDRLGRRTIRCLYYDLQRNSVIIYFLSEAWTYGYWLSFQRDHPWQHNFRNQCYGLQIAGSARSFHTDT
jgi:hypothetical protein